MSDTIAPAKKQAPIAEVIGAELHYWLRPRVRRRVVAERIIAALAAAGYAIVPVEPSAAMFVAGNLALDELVVDIYDGFVTSHRAVDAVYGVMVAAALSRGVR